ncbi:MAG: kinase-like domain-containing protein [Monoraphidium minutum]|nr:MAG: kinase-like domain-containing protein [Monoraphidium minutum]
MLHGDLKASNVLLARCSGAAAAVPASAAGDVALMPHRFTAKVSDFGLALHMGPDATHVSSTHAGTVTHMAPELLLVGRASKASDVYSYGILLWELLTGQRAFAGLPAPLLCIKVVRDHWRPAWPPGVAAPLRALAEACWSPSAAARPSFEEIVAYLEALMTQPALMPAGSGSGPAAWDAPGAGRGY